MGHRGPLPGRRRPAADLHRALHARASRARSGGSSRPAVQEVGSGPVEALDRAAPGGAPADRRRAPAASGAARTAGSRPPMPRLARGEGAALLDRFRRYLRDHRQPVTRQRDLVAQVVLLAEDHLSVDAIQRRLKDAGRAGRHRHGVPDARGAGRERAGPGARLRRGLQALRADAGPGRPRAPHLRALRPRGRVPERAARADAAGHRRRARLPAPAPPGRDLRRLPGVPPARAG